MTDPRSDRPSSGIAHRSRLAWFHRAWLFALVAGTTAAAGGIMHGILAARGLTPVEILLLGLFVPCFGWVAFSFWTAVAGFIVSLFGAQDQDLRGPDGDEPLTSRTAVVVPIFNEDVVAVFAAIEAMHGSLSATGQRTAFDFFMLSDSCDPEIWLAEERAWARSVQRLGPDARLFYRRRQQAIGRKSGNIAEFCRRWGGAYDYMIVLDADSVMGGDTCVALARLMDANSDAGLIQTAPTAVGGTTVFARMQQFAGRLYGPVWTAGQAFWQGGDGNYWGHNAIIRMSAFAAHCGLPVLPGREPFGGHILSHDFVEAALMRRAGWRLWLVDDLGSSYEEVPPTVVDYAIRDRRWCQGNLQHLRVLVTPHLHPASRLHLMIGIGAYVSSLLWLLLLATGLSAGLQDGLLEPNYFPDSAAWLPQWPLMAEGEAIALFAVVAGMLLLPKLLGVVLTAWRERGLRRFGGVYRVLTGVMLEIVFTMLLAPVMMLLHSRFVVTVLAGRCVGWGPQRRGNRRIGLGDAVRHHWMHTIIGILLAAIAHAISPPLLWWLAPLIAGLLLSAPVTWLSSLPAPSRWAWSLGLFTIPEESDPPPILIRADMLRVQGRPLSICCPYVVATGARTAAP